MDYAFKTLRPWIRHCHIHDGVWDDEHPELSFVPIGQGMVDHRRALELLADMNYEGTISGEWINWEVPFERHLPQELATLKSIERDIIR
jgi:sugar phosphate isomerase/epimerase